MIGVTLNVWPEAQADESTRSKACCGLSAVDDARRVADLPGIPYYVLNFRDLFREYVIADFVREYSQRAHAESLRPLQPARQVPPRAAARRALGAEYVATGHYVRRDRDPVSGRYRLRKARDASKDQSYVLFPMRQDELARTLFPLGDREGGDARPGHPLRAPGGRESGEHGDLLRPGQQVRALRDRPAPRRRRSPGPSWMPRGATSASTPGSCTSPSGSAKGWAWPVRSPPTSWPSSRSATR